MECRICGEKAEIFHEFKVLRQLRKFWKCTSCDFIFVDEAHFLNAEAEKEQYLLHENHAENAGYRQLIDPVLDYLQGKEGIVLDYGSGPSPVLAELLSQTHEVKTYDPFFSKEESVLDGQYDFVTSTEVVEHFCEPMNSWRKMLSLLKPGGELLVMTSLNDGVDFANWGYAKEGTHYSFYGRKTMEKLAQIFELELSVQDSGLTVFKN